MYVLCVFDIGELFHHRVSDDGDIHGRVFDSGLFHLEVAIILATNVSGVTSLAAVSFTGLSQTPRRSSYFQNFTDQVLTP